MIEYVIFDHLNRELDVPVYMEHPEVPPKRYVVFEKTGSSKANHLSSATLAIQSYAETMSETMKLNDAVKTAMENAICLPEVSKSKLNSDYNYTDTETNRYRYQAVYDLVHY